MTTNVYVSKAAWTAVTPWAAGATVTTGMYRRQLAGVTDDNARVFKCTTGGTTGGSEPSWNKNNNATTSDNGVVWTQVGGQEAENSAGNWTAPLADINTASTLISAGTGVVIFVSSDHAQSLASAWSFTPANNPTIISVSRTGASIPPTAADYLAGASASTTGASSIQIGGVFCKGVSFNAGSSTNSAGISLGQGDNVQTELEDCALLLNNTNTGSVYTVTSNGSFPSSIRLNNTTIGFGNASQNIQLQSGAEFEWFNCSGAAITGTMPTTLFVLQGGNVPRYAKMWGLDISAFSGFFCTNTGTVPFPFDVFDCKINASMSAGAGDVLGFGDYLKFSNCDSTGGGTNFRLRHITQYCDMTSRADIALVGGASDGVHNYGHLVNSIAHGGSSPSIWTPGRTMWIPQRVNISGSAKTITMEAIVFAASVPDNLALWMEIEALTTSGVPLGAMLTTRQNFPFGTGSANTTTTSDWTAGAPLRQNSHAYNATDVVAVASNVKRLFMCTSAGTTAGSEPGGFSSAVDGGNITDSGVNWLAGWRLKFTKSVTPNMFGIIRARLAHVLASSGSQHYFAYNPKITVT